ncbi:hypothetical protein [Halorussus ruber]|uniref:hypothetical protein n=1 Tax=Halorussus ruber TaxID=1126238 RepID=UPI00109195B9|nr:hypothetical protein [Halorussus ruber]
MDVLKDITDGLRGSDGDESEESDRTGTDARREGAARSSTADSAGDSASNSAGDSAGDSGANGGDSDESGSNASGKSTSSTESAPEEIHVCSFCETEFDAGRDACPECDAKIVLRGAR